MTEVEYGRGGHRTLLGEINRSTCVSMGCPLATYIKEWRRGRGPAPMARPRGVLLPLGVGFPPSLVGLGEKEGGEREEGKGGRRPPLSVSKPADLG